MKQRGTVYRMGQLFLDKQIQPKYISREEGSPNKLIGG